MFGITAKSGLLKSLLLTTLLTGGIAGSTMAATYNAYPGQYKATLMEVEAVNVVQLMVEVWTGFPKKFKITLADISVPVGDSDSPACEIALLTEGYNFTKEFMEKAKDIEVTNIHMERTDEEDAISGIKTDGGLLAKALISRGLARSEKIDTEEPWCADEVEVPEAEIANNTKANAKVNANAISSQKTTTGFMQEITEVRVHTGADRGGKEVYEFRCKGCHEKNTQGAPMLTDNFSWTQRLDKGIDVLMEHAINGYSNYLMPPKGGCRDCNEAEIHAAVIFMLESSGIELTKEQKLLVSK